MRVTALSGDENLDPRFFTRLMNEGFTLEGLLEMPDDETARSIITVAGLTDNISGEEYYVNMAYILRRLSEGSPYLYRSVRRELGEAADMSPRAELLLYGL